MSSHNISTHNTRLSRDTTATAYAYCTVVEKSFEDTSPLADTAPLASIAVYAFFVLLLLNILYLCWKCSERCRSRNFQAYKIAAYDKVQQIECSEVEQEQDDLL